MSFRECENKICSSVLLSKNLRSTILCISVLSVCIISHAKAQSFAKSAWSACGGLTQKAQTFAEQHAKQSFCVFP